MILDIDIGNSYLKWRLIDGSDVIKKGSQIVDSILDSSIFERDILENISGARLCSVVSEATTIALSKQLFSHYDVVLELARQFLGDLVRHPATTIKPEMSTGRRGFEASIRLLRCHRMSDSELSRALQRAS